MDKVNSSNMQAKPSWGRPAKQRGHHSSVDGALQAHRQRTADRQSRTQDRLNMVRNMTNNFFPTQHASERKSIVEEQLQSPVVSNVPIEASSVQIEPDMIAEVAQFNPRQIDDMYSEANLGSSSDNALGLVEKEIANPEDAPSEEMPRGSYVDYTV